MPHFSGRNVMETTNTSRKLLGRLPLYLRYLEDLPEEEVNVSATAIAAGLGLGHVQVRKDLAKVSQEGRCKTGRNRQQLIRDLREYLDRAAASTAIVVGAGSLGQSLLDHSGLEQTGLTILAGFDPHPTGKHSQTGKPIYSMGRLAFFCRCYDVRNGIIAVGAEEAQTVCDGLIACGVQSIWNFAPVPLQVPSHVVVHSGLVM